MAEPVSARSILRGQVSPPAGAERLRAAAQSLGAQGRSRFSLDTRRGFARCAPCVVSVVLLPAGFTATVAQAQEQESKMMDRMMRPNMELANPAQNKKFIAVEGDSVEKKFEAKEFYSGQERRDEKLLRARAVFSQKPSEPGNTRGRSGGELSQERRSCLREHAVPGEKKRRRERICLREKKSVSPVTTPIADPSSPKGTRQKQLSDAEPTR